ncbi:cation:proton antiporter [Noviherbaspirillum aridicola]|uniref:Sodium:proton antiporter n=1 Tax=Noviherbaspirillum aridicola TaxID=2849687 RepID=A0ABQ4Q3I7_9BURK|nr:cation:proton antiporter [Noviherbaspirillum aridicola]GIZ51602.1 sodium:proton antiporter [Noviherbaspirillum aridicola]
MTNAHWFLLIGVLMLARGLTTTALQRSPFTSAIIYLCAGLLVGPTVLNFFYFDPLEQSGLLEVLTEIAVLISLFSAGVKMPVPIRLKRWRQPMLLAWGAMTVTVALIAGFASLALGLPLGAAILLGAILAPTDPVLATDVQSRHPGDKDELRFTLTCEAGMNDGTAFPFVMLGLGLLGLHELGEIGARWLLVDVVWATLAAIGLGIVCGAATARLSWRLRGPEMKHEVLDDLVGLGLIAVAYALCLLVHAWGFLGVFFAGVALRHTELRLASRAGIEPEKLTTAGAHAHTEGQLAENEPPPIVSAESLVFKEHLERLSELMLVLLLGGMLAFGYWNWRSVGLALFVFIVARPLSVLTCLAGSGASWRIRGMVGWFGVRGIGSIYYLMYAIQHGLPHDLARELIQLTLVVITLSILVHGISVKPLMSRFWAGSRQERAVDNPPAG